MNSGVCQNRFGNKVKVMADISSIFMILSLIWFCATQKLYKDITYIKDCDKPKEKLDPNGGLTHNITLTKKNENHKVVGGTIVMTKKTWPTSLNIRVHEIKKNKDTIIYNFTGIQCQNPLVTKLLRRTNFEFNEDCSGNPGIYILQDTDTETFRRSKIVILPPGEYYYEIEYATKKGAIICIKTGVTVKRN